MKKKQTFKLILLILILILAFLTIRDTYSKYITQTGNSSNLNISKWRILLNDEDIRNKRDFTNDISIEYVKSEHIAENVIVPTSKGTFSLELDSTGTELPFEYSIQIAEKKPYNVFINSTSIDEDSSYLYDITLEITNNDTTLDNWTLDFKLPDTIISNKSSFDIADTFTVQDNIVTINSSKEFTQNTTKEINMLLAFSNEINFDINNINLNGTPLYTPTDRIDDFRVTSYILNDLYHISVPSYQSEIAYTIYPPADLSEEVINKFVFYVEWYDEEGNIYNNFEDVEVLKSGLPATIPITLSVSQLKQTP